MLQRVLKNAGVYERLRSSFLYDVYWKFADPELAEKRYRELEFYRTTLKGLRQRQVIFDIGANEGNKTDLFLRLGATVVAVDPDDLNQAALANRFVKRRLRPKSVRIVGEAVSHSQAVTTMWIDAPGSGKNTLSSKWVAALRNDDMRFGQRLTFDRTRQVATTTVEDLMDVHGMPFFIKIDVEGHELSVLQGMKRAVPYLSFEVNLPEFVGEGLQCISRLTEINSNCSFNYTTDCQGLALEHWVSSREFVRHFEGIEARSIEVFWRTVNL